MARKQYDSETHHVTVSSPHDELHRGNGFSIFHDSGSIANNATLEILINTGSTGLHVQMVGDVTGTFSVDTFEGTTVSSNGTAITVFNKNRYSSRTTNASIFHTPTITSDGTKIGIELIGAGKRQGGASEMSRGDQWILKNATSYLVRYTNISGVANRVIANIEWYEPYLGV